MASITQGSHLLSIVIAGLVLATFDALALRISSQDKVEDCTARIKSVKTLEDATSFLELAYLGLEKEYMQPADLAKCLRTEPSEVEREVYAMKNVTDSFRFGTTCTNETATSFARAAHLGKKNDFLFGNAPKLLAPWYEKMARQMIVTCKKNLVTKLNNIGSPSSPSSESSSTSRRKQQQLRQQSSQSGQDPRLHMVNILNLAQNFDLKDVRHMMVSPSNVKYFNSDQMSLATNPEYLPNKVSSTGRIRDLVRFKGTPEVDDDEGRLPRVETRLNREQYQNLKELYASCALLKGHSKDLIEPIASVIKLGYDNDDDGIANEKYLNMWLTSLETCHLLDNVKVLNMGGPRASDDSYLVRFKLGKANEIEDMEELRAELVVPPRDDDRASSGDRSPTGLPRPLSSERRMDQITEIDKDIGSRRWIEKKDIDHMSKPILEKQFLDVFVEFIRKTSEKGFYSPNKPSDYA